MKLPLLGGCICGAVRYQITHEPIRVYACHCTDCQRATVSAFFIGVEVPGDTFRLLGKHLEASPGGVADGGRTKTRWICPDCGICIRGGVKLGMEPPGYKRIVRGGTLDDTPWLNPTSHIYARSRQPWIILPEGAAVYETVPGKL